MKLNFNNFTSHLIFHPFDAATKKDRVIALVISIATAIFSLGLVHAACLIKRCFQSQKTNSKPKIERLANDLKNRTIQAFNNLRLDAQVIQNFKNDFEQLMDKLDRKTMHVDLEIGLRTIYQKVQVTNWNTEDAEAIAISRNALLKEVDKSESKLQSLMTQLLIEVLYGLDHVQHGAGKVFFLKQHGEPDLEEEKYPELRESLKNRVMAQIQKTDEASTSWNDNCTVFYNMMFTKDRLINVRGALTSEISDRIKNANKLLGDYAWYLTFKK